MAEHGWTHAKKYRPRYGAQHQRLRAQWAEAVKTGRVTCWRCQRLIRRSQRWHLGHDDSGERHTGPEHATCNLQAASQAAHARRWSQDPTPEPRTRWTRR